MDEKLIYGIQQVGIGVYDANEAFKWYATKLGADIQIFKDDHIATHMAPYMGGRPHKKMAILALNLQGGGSFELWQYIDRKPLKSSTPAKLGDFGINIITIKSRNIQKSYDRLLKEDVKILANISKGPDGIYSFHIQDPFENIIRIKEFSSWFLDNRTDTGGICGCVLGVSCIEKSLKLYSDILHYDRIIYDKTGTFPDLIGLPNGNAIVRRVLLAHSETRTGGFSKLFGETQIELIQCSDSKPKKIFENRYWGDIGFIHLCFDIRNLQVLINECSEKGFPFRVLSQASFDMGDTNSHWGYIEDLDGTLIEFVETYKITLIKKLNLNINLDHRDPNKPLPNWMIRALALKRIKFK